MAKFGKKYRASAELVDKSKLYESTEAVALVCQTAKAKFDETVELHIRLGVDSRHADQQVRGAIVLPNGTGKTVRTLVFARGDKADAARAAGADYVGAEDMVPKLTRWLRSISIQLRSLLSTQQRRSLRLHLISTSLRHRM